MSVDRVMELTQRWGVFALAVGLVTVAYFVNRFAPDHKKHIRRTVLLFGLYVVTVLAAWLMSHSAGPWKSRTAFLADLFEAFTSVSLVGLFVFDALLPKLRMQVASIVSDLTIGLAYIATSIAVASAAGWALGSVIATSAVVSGILAISLQATLGNVLGGVALQLDGSIHVGDWVQLENGRQGRVRQIRWRHTLVETRDWATIVVPNSSLLASNIMILGKREGQPLQYRMWINFHVDFRYSPSRVVSVVQEALGAAPMPNVAADPKPNCICLDFARDGRDSYALYAVRYFLTDLAADDPTSSAVRERIYAALKRADIPFARPVRSIFVTNEDEDYARRRDERHRAERVAMINRLELFASLTKEERALLAERLVEAPFVAGETVTRQGAVAHWLYVLTEGAVEIRTSFETGPPRTVARLTAPSFFGEMGLMTGEPRLADVVAVTDVECFRLDKGSFERIVQERPEIASAMSATLAKRRVELLAARDELDDGTRHSREAIEQAQILGKIRDFFGLSS